MIKPFNAALRGNTSIRARIRQNIQRLDRELREAERRVEMTKWAFNLSVKEINGFIDDNSDLVESIPL